MRASNRAHFKGWSDSHTGRVHSQPKRFFTIVDPTAAQVETSWETGSIAALTLSITVFIMFRAPVGRTSAAEFASFCC